MELSQFLSSLHPKLIHFPISFILFSIIFECIGLTFKNEKAHWAAKVSMILGVTTMLFAYICGICAEIWAGRAGVPHNEIKWHELAANGTAWGFLALSVWRFFLKNNERGKLKVYLFLCILLSSTLFLTAHLGGDLVYEYGAGVSGARANTILSVHDLNTLAQRQTDLNLRYSDFMHHVFGWLVLILSLTLLLGASFPQNTKKLKWISPILLLGGGIFLFFFADLDLYALTDPRQFYDREVQAHKLFALVMAGFGIYGLIMSGPRKKKKEKTSDQIQFQNRLVAMLALIGGGLLFTHVHSVAPYANIAAGVYINHIALGIVAFAIGGTKLLENIFPKRKKTWTFLFPLLMTFESLLLITYTEGIPWWLGIGHYNRWGVHGGNIAPFGSMRAELTFDPETSDVNVFLLDRFENQPVSIETKNITLLVSHGYQKSAVLLQSDSTNSQFHGQAPFLRHAAMFDASLDLPIQGTFKRGYFDPWVTPVIIGIPPNERAEYVCPMHEGSLSKTKGVCPICGMEMVSFNPFKTFLMHDPKYEVDLEFKQRNKGVQIQITPRFKESKEVIQDLLIVHEYPMHLIMVSEDLSTFDHVHPSLKKDGSFQMNYSFPHGGNYLLFSEFTPQGEMAQVFRLPLTVEGEPHPTQAFFKSDALARQIGDYHVEMFVQPRELVENREAYFGFRIFKEGKPVTDIEPFLGSMGHAVILNQDKETFIHSHPQEFRKILPTDRMGPEVAFHATFPKPGLYKIWGQFKRGKEMIVADFVVNVESSHLPRGLVNFLLFD